MHVIIHRLVLTMLLQVDPAFTDIEPIPFVLKKGKDLLSYSFEYIYLFLPLKLRG